MKNKTHLMLIILLLVQFSIFASLMGQINVVTTFSDYASIVEDIGGDLVTVESLSHGDQDPHFVPPKPSLALKLQDADLFITTGLDLESWAATLQDKARNKKIMDGAVGYVTVYSGIELLEKPTTALSQAEGDIHIYGNPHIHTSPMNWKKISENILIGLKKVDPVHSDIYENNQKLFITKVDQAMFGDDLVQLFGGDRLTDLLLAGTLFEFLENEYQGEKLLNRLGGWLKEAQPFRNKEIIAYHKNWSYFARDFGLRIIGYIETKPGIPPTPKHVEETIQLIQDRSVSVMLVASYFEKRKPTTIAQKTGIEALFLPLSVGATSEVTDNFKLVDYWVDQINNAITPSVQDE